MTTDLAPAEQAYRETYIAIVKKGLATFLEVATALMRLNDGRLYRSTHDTFEAFCRDEFDMTGAYAYRLIAAAKVKDNIESVSPIGEMPVSESVLRPLTTIKDPAEQAATWQAAVATAPNGKPTAKHVKATVASRAVKPAAVPSAAAAQLPQYFELSIGIVEALESCGYSVPYDAATQQTAGAMNVPESMVDDASKLLGSGRADLIAKVEAREITISAALDQIEATPQAIYRRVRDAVPLFESMVANLLKFTADPMDEASTTNQLAFAWIKLLSRTVEVVRDIEKQEAAK